MSAGYMPTRSWPQLIKAKKSKAKFRIVLTVRGRKISKEYERESDFRRWLVTYHEQMLKQKDGAIENIEQEVVIP
jgi:hypothetical protein